MNRDKIGTRTCYIIYQQMYFDVHSMSVSQSCLRSFLCNPYITFRTPSVNNSVAINSFIIIFLLLEGFVECPQGIIFIYLMRQKDSFC